jgi:hypothetical protein
MKLSVQKKWGYVHCRGGRLLQVVHEHPVDTGGHCVVAKQMKEPYEGERHLPPTVMARAGDLAIEIVNRKGGNVLGYSYLSGEAIQINGYENRPDRYEPAVLARARLPEIPSLSQSLTEEQAQQFFGEFQKACVDMKVDMSVDVFAFELIAENDEAAGVVADMMLRFFALVPNTMTDEEAEGLRSHCLGLVQAGSRRGKTYLLHLQPKKHATKHCATTFQAALCWSALGGEAS